MAIRPAAKCMSEGSARRNRAQVAGDLVRFRERYGTVRAVEDSFALVLAEYDARADELRAQRRLSPPRRKRGRR